MAIKRTLTSEEFEALDSEDKELYEESGDGYKIVAESAGALRRAKQHEAEATKRAKEELRSARERIQELETKATAAETKETEAIKARGDFKEYEERLKAKHAQEISAKDAAIRQRDALILGKHAYDKAYSIAKEISTVPDLLADKIASDIGADYNSSGGIELYVKDGDGKKSVDGFEVLTDKYKNDTKYAKVMIHSKASGGGASDAQVNQQASGAFPAEISSKAEKDALYSEMLPDQLEQIIRAKGGG